MTRTEAFLERRWVGVALEAVTALGLATLFLKLAAKIRVDPVDRVGQVSGLAHIGWRFLLIIVPILVLFGLSTRWKQGKYFPLATRLTCAALAGLMSGMVVGAIAVAIKGSTFGLGGIGGDSGVLADWAETILRDQRPEWGPYPPGQIYILVWLAQLYDITPIYAIKHMQFLGLVVACPAIYLTWRLILPPFWALAIGVVAAVPLLEPYRPFPQLILALFIPVSIHFLRVLRNTPKWHALQVAQYGLAFGVAYGALFLLYSGWFQWSAPGLVVAAAIVFPWKTAPRRGLLLGVVAALVFALIVFQYVSGILSAPPIRDEFFYFDSNADPSYIAMWRGGLPGPFANPGMWPPIGEYGGVGLYTIVLAGGLVFALALGHKRTVVIATVAMLVGCWLWRFYYARLMWKTQLVQLYPRTTSEIFYCLMILLGFGAMLLFKRLRSRSPADSPLRSPQSVVAVLCGTAFIFYSAASAIGDKFMPRNDDTDIGTLAWRSHFTPTLYSNQALGSKVDTWSHYEGEGWAEKHLIDNNRRTPYTSELGNANDHEEIVEIKLPVWRYVSKVVLVPHGDGFPVDFEIDIFNGHTWETRVTQTNYPEPKVGVPQEFTWGRNFFYSERIAGVRLRATKLRKVPSLVEYNQDDYVLRLREIEFYR